MKKLTLILSLTILSFTSCSTDDDTTNDQDMFVGTWNLSMGLLNGEDRDIINDCNSRSNFTINADGTFIETDYSTSDANTCELDFADPGTWENLGNNIYRLNYDADADGDTYTEDVIVNGNSFSVYYDDPYVYVYTKS
ncbi:lipocalin family protein [Dokdonia sp. Hel_I_53]|uniref:lipocalin family protein n=1 Tax=Dokdonia sp. Hel_I_53 TaxID=1566287 RepID=UPI00119A6129|nr:lipocalin family protein [Dokdonia sp. Hel_I_53]TVZ51647.1 lipocalin-like protein [Dokdonia sp. Hel_I_53]